MGLERALLDRGLGGALGLGLGGRWMRLERALNGPWKRWILVWHGPGWDLAWALEIRGHPGVDSTIRLRRRIISALVAGTHVSNRDLWRTQVGGGGSGAGAASATRRR